MSETHNLSSRPVADVLPVTVQVGSFRVTALHDGYFELPMAFLSGYRGEPAGEDAAFQLDVNAFLIQDAQRNILVDTGCGSKLGPNVNLLVPSLLAAGVAPSEIDAILCTHIHPDHTNGLIDANGAALYANAQVLVHQNEIDFWLDDERRAASSGELRQSHDWAKEAFAPYAGRVAPFSTGELLTGIESVPLFGHTPGHSGFQIDGGGNQQLIIWGDAVHNIDIQSRDPDVAVLADVNQAEARSTRASLFDRVAADDILVTGMHVTFPGFGRLKRDGQSFEYQPQS